MTKIQCVHPDDMMKVMAALSDELKPMLPDAFDPEVQAAAQVFFGTMFHIALKIFGWLPPEQQSEIFTTCGTWFAVGTLLGRSPERLVHILHETDARVIDTEVPEWLTRTMPTG